MKHWPIELKSLIIALAVTTFAILWMLSLQTAIEKATWCDWCNHPFWYEGYQWEQFWFDNYCWDKMADECGYAFPEANENMRKLIMRRKGLL